MTILHLIIDFVPFLFLFYTGAEVLLRDPRNRLHRLTMGLMFSFSLLFLGDYFGQMFPLEDAAMGFRFKLAGGFFIMTFGLYFFRALSKPSGQPIWFHLCALLPLTGLAPLIVYLPGCDLDVLSGPYFRSEQHGPKLLLLVYVCSLYSMTWYLAMVWMAYRKSRSSDSSRRESDRIRLILRGVVICCAWVLIALALDEPLREHVPMFPQTALNSFAVVAFALFIRHAMVNYDFLSTSSKKYQMLFDWSSNGIFLLDHQGRMVEINPTAARMLGYSEGDKSWKGILLDDMVTLMDKSQYEIFARSIRNRQPLELESRIRNRSGREMIVETKMDYIEVEGHFWRFITNKDITQQKETERKLTELAYQDSLTGLLNRRRFMEILSGKMEGHAVRRGAFCVFVLDLDHFKTVNDTFGHAAGDEMLRTVADRLKRALPYSASIGRVGGDEFFILLDPVTNEESVTGVADAVVKALNEPIRLNGTLYDLTASVGVRIVREDIPDLETVLREADAAMYEAKQSGRNRYCIHA
ncbi:sensor domain-containing diguanylate cyclase [Cohnella caldifontis]|uniref:sensor domain-containing diguanylate cyclase n=1 Tax=Cohnella caldifontis TaxID=3027471 RepID=UPI0023EB9526|nr:sensor domain-containing diguanylate cyclase [Cohnella sp. YIM B05605]